MNGKFTLRRKEEFINFPIKEKLILRNSGGKRRFFSMQEVGRKMIFPWCLRNLHDVLRNEKFISQSSKK